MTYSDGFNVRATSVKFNDVADAIDGVITRGFGGTTTGTSTAYIATPSPVWAAYDNAASITIIPHVTNVVGSPSVTLNISGLGAKAIKVGGNELAAGDLVIGRPAILTYTGVYFELGVVQNALRLDGTNSMVANLNLGGFKATNAAAGTARADLAQIAQVQDGDFIWLGTTGGTATAQTASASPAITAYKAGQKFRMKIGSGLGSTGSTATAHTLNVSSLGAKNLVNNGDNTNPTLGTWVAGAIMEVVYDGTNFVITNDPGGWLSYTPTILNSAGTPPTSGSTIVRARYKKTNKNVTIQVEISFVEDLLNYIHYRILLPINAAGANQVFGARTNTGGAYAFIDSSELTRVRVFKYNNANFNFSPLAQMAAFGGEYESV
jgi:hypothetical protein